MKKFNVALNYLYQYIECDIEAKSKKEATKIFWEEVSDNEGQRFAERAKEFGSISVCEVSE